MATHTLAGKPAPEDLLIDVGGLQRAYYERQPDLDDPRQRVAFGTSGHRGTSGDGTFTEAHVLAIAQAVCDYRQSPRGSTAPCSWGRTPTPSRASPSAPPWRCWPPTAWKR